MNNQPYSPSILPLMQSLAATLADIDFAHERDIEFIEGRAGDPALKARRLRTIKQEHRERRAPYVQELAALQSRVCEGMPDVSHKQFGQDAA
jgi:hypothetical protein